MPRNLRAAVPCPTQPASRPAASRRLRSQLAAQSEGSHPAFRYTSTNPGPGHGPKFIPGVPWFQLLSLLVPQRGEAARGCHTLRVPYIEGALLRSTAPLRAMDQQTRLPDSIQTSRGPFTTAAPFTCGATPGCRGDIPFPRGLRIGPPDLSSGRADFALRCFAH